MYYSGLNLDWKDENRDPQKVNEQKRRLAHKYGSSIGNNLIIRSNSLSHRRQHSGSRRKDASLGELNGHSFSTTTLNHTKIGHADKRGSVQSSMAYDLMDFSKKPDLSNVNTFFKNELHKRLEMCKLQQGLETMKANVLHREVADAFDKREVKFCKKILGTLKDTEMPRQNIDHDLNMGNLALEHRLVETELAISDNIQSLNELKRMEELKQKEKKVREMWLKQSKEGKNPHLTDIILKNKKVFQVENIMLLRKRMEKDSTLGDPVLKSTEVFKMSVEKMNQRTRFERNMIVDEANQAKL